MSHIGFTTKERSVEVRGMERGHLGSVINDLTVGLIDLESVRVHAGSRKQLFTVLSQVVSNGDYIRKTAEENPLRAMDMVRTSLVYGREKLPYRGGQSQIDFFTMALNTALAVGNDAWKLAARIHGQCEIHGWIERPNREWLAEIVRLGLSSGFYRKGMGWDGLIELLTEAGQGPVVMDYSVCESFPDSDLAELDFDDYETEKAWYDKPYEQRFDEAVAGLRAGMVQRELKPDNWESYRFGDGITAFDYRNFLIEKCKGNPTSGI